MLASSDMLTLYDSNYSNETYRPKFTITYSSPVGKVSLSKRRADGYRLPETSKGLAIEWTASDILVLPDGHTIVSQTEENKEVTLTASVCGDVKTYEVTVYGKSKRMEAMILAHFAFDSEYRLRNKLDVTQAISFTGDMNARWNPEYDTLRRNTGASNLSNTDLL